MAVVVAAAAHLTEEVVGVDFLVEEVVVAETVQTEEVVVDSPVVGNKGEAEVIDQCKGGEEFIN